jgi:hypothetical protein
LFDHGSANSGKRPADWLETGGELSPAEAARSYLGRCFDMTYVTGDAEAAQVRKHVKYKDAMMELKNYGLTVFSVNYEGSVSSGGMETLRRWAVNLTRHRKFSADLAGTPTKEVTAAFATGFAMVTALQLAAYVTEASGPQKNTHWARLPWRPTRQEGAPPAKRACPPVDIDSVNLGGPAAQAHDSDRILTTSKQSHGGNAVFIQNPLNTSSILRV